MQNTALKRSCFPNRLIVAFLYNEALRVLPCFQPSETSIRFYLGTNPITRLDSSLQRESAYIVIFILARCCSYFEHCQLHPLHDIAVVLNRRNFWLAGRETLNFKSTCLTRITPDPKFNIQRTDQ